MRSRAGTPPSKWQRDSTKPFRTSDSGSQKNFRQMSPDPRFIEESDFGSLEDSLGINSRKISEIFEKQMRKVSKQKRYSTGPVLVNPSIDQFLYKSESLENTLDSTEGDLGVSKVGPPNLMERKSSEKKKTSFNLKFLESFSFLKCRKCKRTGHTKSMCVFSQKVFSCF